MGVSEKFYDVIIVGGGIVGLTLALLLQHSDKRIALLDKRGGVETFKPEQYDVRVSAITPASHRLFEKLNVWESMAALRVSPFNQMEVWDGDGRIEFDAASVGELTLGYIVENNVMLQVLWQTVLCSKSIDTITHLNLESLERLEEKSMMALHTDQGVFTAPLIIGADGAESWLRQAAQIELKTRDYQHHALVCTVKTERPHHHTARQVFMPQGPLAFLPLAEPDLSSIVWSSNPTHIEKLMALPDVDFASVLREAFQDRLGAILEVRPRARFPLIRRHAKQYVQPGLALVGDAAHTIHPLAGQGLNLGLADAALLAELILSEYAHKQERVKYSTLRRYERARKADNTQMLVTMDGFRCLFGNDIPALKWLRQRGLNLTHRLPWVKEWIVQQTIR